MIYFSRMKPGQIALWISAGIFFGFEMKAQPVFTSGFDFQVGQSITVRTFEQNTLSPGPEGANQTWSFTNAPPGDPFTASIIAPAGTPAAAEFPLANKVFRYAGDTIELFQYYLAGSQQTESLGATTISNIPEAPPNIVIKFSDTRITSKYPMNFGQSFTDTYASSFSQVVEGQVASISYTNGISTTRYDAYGTISTPAGTFSNCIRMKITNNSTDSLVFPSIPIPGLVSRFRSTTYLWFHQSGTAFPVVFQLEMDTVTGLDGTPVATSSGYYSQQVTAVRATESRSEGNYFPNPASEFIRIPGMNSVRVPELKLLSGDGRAWHCPVVQGKADIRAIPSGIYQVVPENPGIPSGRFIKH